MPEGIESLVYPYSSWNEAYRKFRDEYRYLNTFFYLFLTGKENIQEHLKAQIAKHDEGKVERGESLDYAMGVVTHAYSRSKFKGVHVARSDAVQMVADFGGFLSIVSKHCVVAAHRAVVDYSFDLLRELHKEGYIEFEEKVRESVFSQRIRPAKLSSLLEDCNIPIATENHALMQWRWLAELRNCIEHNGSRATTDFTSLVSELEIEAGDPIPIGPKEVGEALALVEEICSAMNQKAHAQYYSAKQSG